MKCFYHSVDLDGKCSGAIVKLNFPDCEMFPINYGDEFPWVKIANQEPVFMVDFSLPAENMLRLRDMCQLIWIDHHKTALTDSINFGYDNLEGLRHNDFAGCELTWKYIHHGVQIPRAVYLLGRYDIWDHTDPDVIPFQYGMRIIEDSAPGDAIWGDILNKKHEASHIIQNIIHEGTVVYEFEKLNNKRAAKHLSFEISNFFGFRAIAANKSHVGSMFFDDYPDIDQYDLVILFHYAQNKWNVSLYSSKPHVDVSKIAKDFGGGGHKGAAGFSVDDIQVILNMK